MRTRKELIDIATQLGILEEFHGQLQSLDADVNIVLQKCTSWIEKEGNQTYLEIKEFLTKEISECILRCYSIASREKGKLTESSFIKEEGNKTTEMTLDTHFSDQQSDKDSKGLIDKIHKHSEMIKILQKKLKYVEKQNKTLSKQKQESNSKNNESYGEIMEELHVASNFMAHLQTQTDDLSNEINKINLELNENKEKYKGQDTNKEDVSRKVEVCLQKVSLLANSNETLQVREIEISKFKTEEGNLNLALDNLKEEIHKLTVDKENLRKENTELKEKLDSTNKAMDKETKIRYALIKMCGKTSCVEIRKDCLKCSEFTLLAETQPKYFYMNGANSFKNGKSLMLCDDCLSTLKSLT